MIKKDEQRDLILTKPTAYLFNKLCVPGIVGMVVIALYSFMDSIYAGKMISEEAMAAIGIAYPITLINNSLTVLFGMGGASILSRAIGADDDETAQSVLPTVSFFILIASLATTVIGFFGANYLLRLSGAEGEILRQGTEYLRLVFLGSLFVNYTQSMNMLIRAEGRMVKAMSIMGAGAILNIILDPIFILLFPEIGVAAVAYATILAQIFQAVLTVIYFKRWSPGIQLAAPKPNPAIVKGMLAVGLSAMIMQIFGMVQQLLFYNVAFKYGGDTYGIMMSAFLRIQMFAFIPLWGMSQGFQPYVGTNFGAKKYKRLLQGRREFILIAFAITMIFFLPVQLAPRQVISLFINDPALIQQAIGPIRLFFSTFFLYGFMVMIGTYFQSVGDAKTAGLIIVGRSLILFTPLIFIIPKLFGGHSIWFVQAVCDILIIIFAFYKFGQHGKLLRQGTVKDSEVLACARQ
ncbi:MAG: MATE family efflux transporter [Eubacteriales bacterium]|nr:MATE family efflux transporter [Eubacteriales bacterium]